MDIAIQVFLLQHFILRFADLIQCGGEAGVVWKLIYEDIESLDTGDGLILIVLRGEGFLEIAYSNFVIGGADVNVIREGGDKLLVLAAGIGEFVDGKIAISLFEVGVGSGSRLAFEGYLII
jgi:hypothetical protein